MRIKLFTFIFLAIAACQTKPEGPKHIIYGLLEPAQDSLGVELDLTQFQTLRALVEQAGAIPCQDSLPKIVIRKADTVKSVYLQNPCMKNLGCVLISRKNLVTIRNGFIYRYAHAPCPLDSLEPLLSRNFANYGEDRDLSDIPARLIIDITSDSVGLEQLPELLDRITIIYEQAIRADDTTANLNVRLMQPPPPPPPPPPNRSWN